MSESPFLLAPDDGDELLPPGPPRRDGEPLGITWGTTYLPGYAEPVPMIAAVAPGSYAERRGLRAGTVPLLACDEEGNDVAGMENDTAWVPSVGRSALDQGQTFGTLRSTGDVGPADPFALREEVNRDPNAKFKVDYVVLGFGKESWREDRKERAGVIVLVTLSFAQETVGHRSVTFQSLKDHNKAALVLHRAATIEALEKDIKNLDGWVLHRGIAIGAPEVCCGCSQPAARFVGAPIQFQQDGDNDDVFHILRTHSTPLCDCVQDSVCYIRAMQRAFQSFKRTEGRDLFHQTLQRCWFCHKMEEEDGRFKRCSNCRVAFYCSKDCQTKAWKSTHKEACKKVAS